MRDDSVQQPINCSAPKLNSVKVRLSDREPDDELGCLFLLLGHLQSKDHPFIEQSGGLEIVSE
jgi:hypothetical protein